MGTGSSRSKRVEGDELVADSPGAALGDVPGGTDLWVTIKAKTTSKRSRDIVLKKRYAFRASAHGVSIGSDAACSIPIEDPSLSPQHARVHLDEAGNVVLDSAGRTYYLIGQGSSTGKPHVLEKDQVVKMGACSLQVTESCVSKEHRRTPATAPRVASPDSACYICFDESNTDPDNPLEPSPCACAKPVHKLCLSRWIATRGSRLCSICKSKLPTEITVDPPFLVLQVVRHMRGLHWHGEREYIISFKQRPTHAVTVGSGGDCDLVLPDPSLSRMHSRLTYRDNQFVVEDLHSLAGTFLKLAKPFTLTADGTGFVFKMGRTVLTVRVKRKRQGILPQWRRTASATYAAASSPPQQHSPTPSSPIAATTAASRVARALRGVGAAEPSAAAALPGVRSPAQGGAETGAVSTSAPATTSTLLTQMQQRPALGGAGGRSAAAAAYDAASPPAPSSSLPSRTLVTPAAAAADAVSAAALVTDPSLPGYQERLAEAVEEHLASYYAQLAASGVAIDPDRPVQLDAIADEDDDDGADDLHGAGGDDD